MNKLIISMSILASMIIAHRGGALLGTENSLSCIEKGIATGADMVEVDLHLTADKQIVVCHDQKVDRTTNGKGRIEEMTLAEIQKLRLLVPFPMRLFQPWNRCWKYAKVVARYCWRSKRNAMTNM